MNTIKYFHSVRKAQPPTTKAFKSKKNYSRKLKNGKVISYEQS